MKRFLLVSLLTAIFFYSKAQFSLTVATYSQDFNGLGTGSSTVAGGDLNLVSASLNGWYFAEVPVNTTITAGTGSLANGDSYNFGTSGGADRTLGGLRSGSVVPSYGFYFTNNTGSTITSLAISYTGETWRVGAAGRPDRIDFQYSTNATSLTTGTWTDVDLLDYANPGQAIGNGSVQHSAIISNSITGLTILNGATVFIRWTDFDVSGADDGMGVEDFGFTATLGTSNTITTGTVSSPPFVLADCSATATGTVAYTSTGTFNGGNIFTAQLSNEVGSFASPVNIGTDANSGLDPSGTINITIPAGTVGGTGYRIRVVSSDPVATGSSSAAFTITQLGVGGCSSALTDHYRSNVASGLWATPGSWESSPDNTNWITATQPPTSLANTITIRNGHTINIAASTTADQLVILSGGVLEHSLGTFTIDDGSGDDVDIQNGGIMTLSSTANAPVFTGSAVCNVATGAILRVSATGLTGAGTGVNLNNYDYENASILEYTLTASFSSSGVTFFPNAGPAVIPIFRSSNLGSITVGAAAATTFNGVFESNGAGVVWQSGGIKTFRNGIIGSGNVSTLLGSGNFVINGTTATLGGSGIIDLSLSPASVLQFGASTVTTLTSDKTVNGNVSILTDSYIDVGTFDLTVTGTVTNATVTSYVRTNSTGTLILNNVGFGSSGKLFPIGRSSINPLFIQSGTIANYSARVSEPVLPGLVNPSYAVDRNWHISSSVAGPNAFISFGYTFPDDCGVDYVNAFPVEIGVYVDPAWNLHQANLTPSPFIPVPGTYVVTNTVSINYFNGVDEFPFVIGNNGTVLPSDYFVVARAQKHNGNGIINWTITDADNVRSFEVQRSVNGGSFVTIATANPVSNQYNYSYTDASLQGGTLLYRIKVNRLSGGIRYSNTVAIINDSKGLLITSVTPNPVQQQAAITVSVAKQGKINFEVIDMVGRKAKSWVSPVSEGTNIIQADLSSLPAGVYHVTAQTMDTRTVFRFVKQ